MPRYRCVVFTWNNPDGHLDFVEDKMEYLVYQEEVGDSGTYHFQGYCEFKYAMSLLPLKELLGGLAVHIEARRGTQEQAIAYAKKEDTRVDGPFEFGTPRSQGKRVDLEAFKDAVLSGKRKRDLVEDHYVILARYGKFYDTLTMMNRPRRSTDLVVTLLYGPTGTGKTRWVMDKFGQDDDFYRAPLNNGTMWYDTYDGHAKVLLDDFAGKASYISLCSLLQLLDRYPILVPTKGSHTWWLPDEVFVTTNILPKNWYTWENRAEQYKALARRFHKVSLYNVPVPGTDRVQTDIDSELFFRENAPEEAVPLYCNPICSIN